GQDPGHASPLQTQPDGQGNSRDNGSDERSARSGRELGTLALHRVSRPLDRIDQFFSRGAAGLDQNPNLALEPVDPNVLHPARSLDRPGDHLGAGGTVDAADPEEVAGHATNLHTCATRKHTTKPITTGNRLATAVHRALPVSL